MTIDVESRWINGCKFRKIKTGEYNGTRSFTKKDYVALADFFDTSVDYLMGRTLDPWPVDAPQAEGVAS